MGQARSGFSRSTCVYRVQRPPTWPTLSLRPCKNRGSARECFLAFPSIRFSPPCSRQRKPKTTLLASPRPLGWREKAPTDAKQCLEEGIGALPPCLTWRWNVRDDDPRLFRSSDSLASKPGKALTKDRPSRVFSGGWGGSLTRCGLGQMLDVPLLGRSPARKRHLHQRYQASNTRNKLDTNAHRIVPAWDRLRFLFSLWCWG